MKSEVYYQSAGDELNTVFGYNERWSEYRYKNSIISGLFRANATGTLQAWHISEDFDQSTPILLNADFIEDKTNEILDRNLAVPSEPDIIADIWFDYQHARVMPTYSVPGLSQRF